MRSRRNPGLSASRRTFDRDAALRQARYFLDGDFRDDDPRRARLTDDGGVPIYPRGNFTADEHDSYVAAASTALRDGVALPQWLATYIADELGGLHPRLPRHKRVFARDQRVCWAVFAVAQGFHVAEYSNGDDATNGSAASIVAEASGLPISTVIHIWKAHWSARGKVAPADLP